MADAAEHAENVLALAENADVVECCTLVNVDARSFVVLGCESHVALTAVTARMVDALAIATQRRDAAALVNVLALEAVAGESAVADALERSVGVYTGGVGVAASVLSNALVHVCARDAVSLETVAADALERAVLVDALGEFTAVILAIGALVVIGAVVVAFLDRVSRLAAADIRSKSVLTSAVLAQVSVSLAFVVIYASLAVGCWEKPVRAGARVPALGVATLATAARVQAARTLVHVDTADAIWRQFVSWMAGAEVAARGVGALRVAVAPVYFALVNILAARL